MFGDVFDQVVSGFCRFTSNGLAKPCGCYVRLEGSRVKTNPWNNRKEGLMSEGFELRGSQVLWKFRVQASGVDDFGIVKAFIALNFEQ